MRQPFVTVTVQNGAIQRQNKTGCFVDNINFNLVTCYILLHNWQDQNLLPLVMVNHFCKSSIIKSAHQNSNNHQHTFSKKTYFFKTAFKLCFDFFWNFSSHKVVAKVQKRFRTTKIDKRNRIFARKIVRNFVWCFIAPLKALNFRANFIIRIGY